MTHLAQWKSAHLGGPRSSQGADLRCFSAFSLIELLTVMALIAVLSVPIAHLVREGSDARAMKSAQNLLAAQLTSARTHAIVSRAACRLLVYSDRESNPELGDRLRRLQIAIAQGDGTWRAVGAASSLPGNIRLVPKAAPPTLRPGGWGDAPTSSLPADAAFDVWWGDRVQRAHYYFVEFSPLGNTTGATLVLSPAVIHPVGEALAVCFTQPTEVSGVRLSQYGALTLIPHTLAFQ